MYGSLEPDEQNTHTHTHTEAVRQVYAAFNGNENFMISDEKR